MVVQWQHRSSHDKMRCYKSISTAVIRPWDKASVPLWHTLLPKIACGFGVVKQLCGFVWVTIVLPAACCVTSGCFVYLELLRVCYFCYCCAYAPNKGVAIVVRYHAWHRGWHCDIGCCLLVSSFSFNAFVSAALAETTHRPSLAIPISFRWFC